MKYIILLINLILLLLGYSVFLNQWVPPSFCICFSYAALIFPIVFVLNFLLLIYWFIFHRKVGVLMLALSLGLLIPFNKIYHIWGGNKSPESNLTIMTYNLKVLSKDKGNIKPFIKEKNPDIVFLQELPQGRKHVLDDGYPYVENYQAISILSKYPIIESKQLKLGDRKLRACYADIKFRNDTIRVINVHLSSTRLTKKMFAKATETEGLKESTRVVTAKLSSSFGTHQREANEIARLIARTKYPIIVAGDFNAVPSSYEYYKIGNTLQDAFVAGGNGLGTTFHDYQFPIKIDHVFASKDFGVHQVEIDRVPYSDHFPVIVKFNFNPKK
ncbi:endonuclease/exonuclease/phosphatase family protein [Ornithobacterium rhinotracheale]